MKDSSKAIGKFILAVLLNTICYYIAESPEHNNDIPASKKAKKYQNECIDTSSFLD